MNINMFPTKGNLIAAKNSLALARQGYDLMDKKRNILVREMMELVDQASTIQTEIDTTFRAAYEALQQANIEMGLTIIGLIREILGAGTFFNIKIFGDWFTPITIFIMAPGAFLVLGFLVAGMNIIRKKMEAKGTPLAEPAGCLSGDCAHCGASCPSAKAAQAAVAPNTTEGGDK